MQPHITTASQQCAKLIMHFEQLRLNAYLCPAGVPTIGYGTTRYPPTKENPRGEKVKLGDRITADVAARLLKYDLTRFEKDVDDITTDTITQQQFDALVSFTYNEGQTNLRSSSLLALINKGDFDKDRITAKFLLYDKARVNGRLVELDGLKRRRKAEAHLFNNGQLKFFENEI